MSIHLLSLSQEAKDERAEHQIRTLDLADAYRAACELVQPAWIAMLATPTSTPERVAAIATVNAASKRAREAHVALIDHVRGDASEVGR